MDNCVHYQVVLIEILPRNKNGDFPKEKFICSVPKLQDIAYFHVFYPSLGPNAWSPLGSCIMQYFEKFYGQNLTIICRAKGWAVDGCGNCDQHYRHVD